jgi:hypothetical protein
MDAPDLPPARLVETLKGLSLVNLVTRSSRLMWPDLKATARRHPHRPIRLLDVACGGGDVLLTLWRAARKAGLSVEFAGALALKNSPHTLWCGARVLSSNTTATPLRASSSANAAPARPPPTAM